MLKPILASLALVTVCGPVLAAPSATLTIKIEGVTAQGGDLRVGVFNEQQFDVRGSKPTGGVIVPARAGEDVVTISDLPAGDYGVKVLQDVNKNGHMDFRLGMFPLEPFGMSNDAKPVMGPAPWDDAKFTLKTGTNVATIHLQ